MSGSEATRDAEGPGGDRFPEDAMDKKYGLDGSRRCAMIGMNASEFCGKWFEQ